MYKKVTAVLLLFFFCAAINISLMASDQSQEIMFPEGQTRGGGCYNSCLLNCPYKSDCFNRLYVNDLTVKNTLYVDGVNYSTPSNIASALSTLASTNSLSKLATALCTANSNPCPKAYGYWYNAGGQLVDSCKYFSFNRQSVEPVGMMINGDKDTITLEQDGLYLIVFSIDFKHSTMNMDLTKVPTFFGLFNSTGHEQPAYGSNDPISGTQTGFTLSFYTAGTMIALRNYCNTIDTKGRIDCLDASSCGPGFIDAALLILQIM